MDSVISARGGDGISVGGGLNGSLFGLWGVHRRDILCSGWSVEDSIAPDECCFCSIDDVPRDRFAPATPPHHIPTRSATPPPSTTPTADTAARPLRTDAFHELDILPTAFQAQERNEQDAQFSSGDRYLVARGIASVLGAEVVWCVHMWLSGEGRDRGGVSAVLMHAGKAVCVLWCTVEMQGVDRGCRAVLQERGSLLPSWSLYSA